ncbi:MAG: tetratricopeptide repeat protein, partial [Terriglobia bacterium]
KPSGDTVGVRELAIPGKARKAFAKGIRELYEKKRPDRSLRHFRKAIELYADYDEAYVQLSLAHFQQADYAQAQHVLETGLAVNPGNTRAYVVLGLVYKQQRQAQRAIQAWKRAVKLDENAWRAHFELGKTFLVAGNIEEAQKHAQRAHQLKPQAPSVHLLVYNLCLLQDDREAALAELDEFLALHPQNPWAPQLRQRRIILRQSLGFSP